MNTIVEPIEDKSLIEKGSELIRLKKELFELNLKDKSSKVGSKITLIVLSSVMIILSFVFLGLTLAFVLNNLLDSQVWGFAITALLFIIGAIALFNGGSGIRRSISFQILKLLDEDDDEEELY
ncbi:Putative Holin-X, holin superfamily III [Spirosomataceae bacterium TFI 002]|nr:Putative Holin-X, holin superfamily III [Spirosomataceae bacterium TFI 002]